MPGGQYEELDCLHLGGTARVASGSFMPQKGPGLASTIAVPVSHNPAKSKNVTFFSELNQRHLPEMRLPRWKRDAPVSFIGLVISTINMLSGRDELHVVNKH
ncbi:unnamed protein product [Sphagnum balticum]